LCRRCGIIRRFQANSLAQRSKNLVALFLPARFMKRSLNLVEFSIQFGYKATHPFGLQFSVFHRIDENSTGNLCTAATLLMTSLVRDEEQINLHQDLNNCALE
jgi:hypothetical protein